MQPAIAVRFCPILFEVEKRPPGTASLPIDLPYRMVFAIATRDSVVIYDTQVWVLPNHLIATCIDSAEAVLADLLMLNLSSIAGGEPERSFNPIKAIVIVSFCV